MPNKNDRLAKGAARTEAMEAMVEILGVITRGNGIKM
jgi:hypothetical protein